MCLKSKGLLSIFYHTTTDRTVEKGMCDEWNNFILQPNCMQLWLNLKIHFKKAVICTEIVINIISQQKFDILKQ